MALEDESIPGEKVSQAADWLGKQNAYEFLPEIAKNGATPLFWYVAFLLIQYKEFSCRTA